MKNRGDDEDSRRNWVELYRNKAEAIERYLNDTE
jgi:hypothetical protein